ncbi:MAG: mercuric transporter MerT family protein [Bauldia sp.]
MSATNELPHAVASDKARAIEPGGLTEGRADQLLAVGGILAAIGAASCCVVPFALFMLGISGAWIGNLTALEPYQPIFATLAAGAIGYGFYLVYRKPKVACEDGSYCASRRSTRVTETGLWVATVLVVVAIGFPRLAPLFL